MSFQTTEFAKSEAISLRERVWLLGQPHLQDYLDFVREKVVGGAELDPRALADEWRAANDYYHELEESEAGVADQVECRPLPPEMELLAEEVAADPYCRRAFDTLPVSFGLVELDRLTVSQPHVTRQHVDRLKLRLGRDPDPVTLFRFCLPKADPEAAFEVQETASNRYLFASESTDLRSHSPVLLRADQINNHATFGPIGRAVGVVVGFGSNLLNVIRSENRIVLNNGYHRACALRELGVTHAPCLMQTVTRRDELDISGPRAVAEAPEFYFRSKRPPLLKDFFDPRIRKVWPVRRIRKVIEVEVKIREYQTAE